MPEPKYVKKCLYCERGEKELMGIVEIKKQIPWADDDPPFTPRMLGFGPIAEYACGLGELGKDCTVPANYRIRRNSSAKEGMEIYAPIEEENKTKWKRIVLVNV